MDYSSFIGTRYIQSKKKRTISAIATIAITGVAIGVGALSSVLCISTGFQDEFTSKVLGVNAHVLVMKYGMNFHEYKEVMRLIKQVPGVKAQEPFVIQEMMISNDDQNAGVLLKGIDPALAKDVLDLPSHLVKGSLDGLRLPGSGPPPTPITRRTGFALDRPGGPKTATDTETDKEVNTRPTPNPSAPLPGIVIGQTLAENLHATVGDTVQITTPLIGLDMLGWNDQSETPRYLRFKVIGIFYAGFLEYDTKLAFVDYYQAQRFFDQGDAVTGIELLVSQVDQASQVARHIEKTLAGGLYRTVDWEELNRPLFTALKTQKLAFTVILSIIVALAAFNIIATLVMMVFDKRKEIAILKSMGATHGGVMRIFLHAGMMVGTIGIAIGLTLGYSVCAVLDKVGWSLDPEVYLIDHLPVTLDWTIFAAAALVAFSICLAATIIPALSASLLRPVDGLREE